MVLMRNIFVCVLFFPIITVAQDYSKEVDKKAKDLQQKLVEWRRHIHQNPELSNREFKTQQYIITHLKQLGIPYDTIAKTGVIGTIKGSKPGPVVALRADIDALPVLERNELPYKSKATAEYLGQTVPVMHACGHDAHTSMLMGAAEVLNSMRNKISGTVKLFFQPAEEGPPGDEEGGAPLMIKQGAMDDPKVDAVFGLHIQSMRPEGNIYYRAGAFMAESDWFTIKVKGKQSHGSQPWLSVDPIAISAQIINGLQQIVSRQMDLTKAPVVLTVGKISSGVRSNIIPEEAEMAGTIRILDSNMRQPIFDKVRKMATSIAEANGATVEVITEAKTLITYNDDKLTKQMLPSLVKTLGADKVHETNWVTGAEDFSFYGQKAPTLFLYYGGMDENAKPGEAYPHHTPDFRISDKMLYNGVKVLCNLVFDYKKLP